MKHVLLFNSPISFTNRVDFSGKSFMKILSIQSPPVSRVYLVSEPGENHPYY
jgi:hypothetical protein